ncbi:hypothetical protein [Clostridium sp.]
MQEYWRKGRGYNMAMSLAIIIDLGLVARSIGIKIAGQKLLPDD